MKKNPDEHPEALLLDYLEGTLSSDDRAGVEGHLKECRDCSEELKELELITKTLQNGKEKIFCPESWELCDFARTGDDPEGKLAAHTDHCSECRAQVLAYQRSFEKETITPQVRAAFEAISSSDRADRLEPTGWLSGVMERISSSFKMSGMAVGAAAAAILLFAIIYPFGRTETIAALSSVEWKQAGPALKGKPKNLVDEKKVTVAIIILLKGLPESLPQKMIDRFYKDMEPTARMQEHWEFVSPSRIRQSLGETGVRVEDGNKLLETLVEKLDLSRVVIVTVQRSGDRFTIESELKDPRTGGTLGKFAEQSVSESGLSSAIGRAVNHLLLVKLYSDSRKESRNEKVIPVEQPHLEER